MSGIRLKHLKQRCGGWIDHARYLLNEALKTAPGGDPACDAAVLEDRVLLSATPIMQAMAASGWEAGIDAPLAFGPEAQASVLRIDQVSAEAAVQRREVVFLDPSAADYQALIDDLSSQTDRDIDLMVLDGTRNGVEQISGFLADYGQVDAIHIVSHAQDGAVRLGDAWLDDSALEQYADSIASWGTNLTSDADILLYGCELAGEASGRSLIESISRLTGADVAASVDDTGHAFFGGDWDLEFSTGHIQTDVAFSQHLQSHWGHLLNVTVDATSLATSSEGNIGESLQHTTAGSDRLMLVGISFGTDQGNSVSSVSYNGTALTLVGARDHSDAATSRVEIWSLVAPDVGTHSVDVAFSGNSHKGATIGVMTFNGVDQMTALGSFASNSGDSGNLSATIASGTGEVVYSVAAIRKSNDVNLVVGAGQTEQWELFSDEANGAGSTQAGATSVVSSWSSSDNDKWVVGGVSILPSTGALAPIDEFRVNTHTSNTQETSLADRGSHRAVAIAPDGDYVAVWSSLEQDGSGWGVYGQLYDKHGVARGTELHISSGTSLNAQQGATVDMDEAGNFVVAWSRQDSSNGYDVYARRYDNSGTALGGEFRVNDASAEDRSGASIAVADDGSFVIAWQGADGLLDDDIFVRHFDADGLPLDVSDLVVEAALGVDSNPAVAINDSGQFAVLWQNGGGVQVQRFQANGSVNGSQLTVDSSLDAATGSIAMHSDGSLAVVWSDGLLGLRNVYLARYDSTGAAASAASVVNTSTAGEQTHPSITMDEQGNFLVVWEGSGDQAGSVDNVGVFGQKYDATGTAVGGEFLINQSTTGNQHMASAAMLNLDNYVVLWSGNGDRTGPVDASGVFARQFGEWNAPPVADAGGAYAIVEGDSLNLVGSGSSDPDGSALTFAWDLDNDGNFGEIGEPTSETPSVSWATLQAWGIDDDGSYTIGVQVDDGNGGFDTSTATLTVSNTAPTLSVTAATTVDEDAIYNLSLSASDSGEDTITQWTVDWGDGTVTTHAFSAGTATHSYASGGSYDILVSATDEDGTFIDRDLLVAASETGGDNVYRFDVSTGDFGGTLGSSGGELLMPIQAVIGPQGDIYVSGFASDNIVRYDSAGNYLGEFVTAGLGGLDGAAGFDFDTDGNLYVASFNTKEILRYDASGAFVGVHANSSGGILKPCAVVFGPDGDLYVSSTGNGKIFKYDVTNGGAPVTFINGGNLKAEQIAFDQDGAMYFADAQDNTVKKYDGTLTTVVALANDTSGIALSPDGVLYVSSSDTDEVLMFDATTGASRGSLVASGSGGLDSPHFLTLVPDQRVQVAHVADTPTVTNASTLENISTTSGLVISRNASDGAEVTHYKITGITAGTLYHNDGVTQINDGDFITIAAGAAGLKFTPTYSFTGTASFDITASLAGDDSGLGGSAATASITVIPNLPPTVALAQVVSPINENTSTAGGLKVADILISDDGNGTNTLALTGADAASFEIVGQELRIRDGVVLDYESKSSYAVSVTVDDGTVGATPDDSAAVTIQLADVNEFDISPISDVDASVNAVQENAAPGTAVGITALAADADATNSTISYSLDNSAGGRFAIDSTTGLVTVNGSLDAETATSHSIVVRATSQDASTSTLSLTVTVLPINDNLPVFTSSAPPAISENQTLVVALTASDADLPAQNLQFTITGGDDAGRFVIDGSNVLKFAMAPDYEAPLDSNGDNLYEVEVTADDGEGGTSTQSITVAVDDENERPSVTSVSDQSILEDQSSGPLAFTIGDPETAVSGLILSVTSSNAALVDPSSLTLGGSGANRTLTVEPLEHQFGSTTITISVSDGALSSSTSFVVDVQAVNDAPFFQSAANVAIDENHTMVVALIASDVDLPAQNIQFAITGGDDAGRFVIDGSNVLKFAAAPDYEAPLDSNGDNLYQLEVTADDGEGGTTVQSITVAVSDENEAPSVTSVSDQSILEDQSSGPLAFTIGDPETTASALILTVTSSNAALVDPSSLILGGSGANRTLTVEPLDQQFGSTTITILVSDGTLSSSTSFVVEVQAVNDAPTIQPIADVTIPEDGAGVVALVVGDAESSAGSLTITATSDNPSLIPNGSLRRSGGGATRNLSFQPAADQFGSATVTVQVSDGVLTTSESFRIDVTPVNDVPTAQADRFRMDADGSITFTAAELLGNDSDVDGDALSIEIVSMPTAGTLLDIGGGQFEYQAWDADNAATFTYRVFDGVSYSDSVTVRLQAALPIPSLQPTPQQPVTQTPATQPVDSAPADSPPLSETSDANESEPTDESAREPVGGAVAIHAGLRAHLAAQRGISQGAAILPLGAVEAGTSAASAFSVVSGTTAQDSDDSYSRSSATGQSGSSQRFGSGVAASASAAAQVRAAIAQQQLWQAVSTMQEQVGSSVSNMNLTVGATVTATTGLSVGYVIWVVRGGILLSSVVANLPMWRLMDPMAILDAVDDGDTDEESLESMVDEQSAGKQS